MVELVLKFWLAPICPRVFEYEIYSPTRRHRLENNSDVFFHKYHRFNTTSTPSSLEVCFSVGIDTFELQIMWKSKSGMRRIPSLVRGNWMDLYAKISTLIWPAGLITNDMIQICILLHQMDFGVIWFFICTSNMWKNEELCRMYIALLYIVAFAYHERYFSGFL